MGMFDEIVCEYPLPGQPPQGVNRLVFQTKDLECLLQRYTITADGRLANTTGKGEGFGKAGGDYRSFAGEVEFYTNNVAASGPGIYTRSGEAAFYLTYRALFEQGRVVKIDEVENRREPAVALKLLRLHTMETAEVAEEAARQRAKRDAIQLGQQLCVQPSFSKPYMVKVLLMNQHQELVVQKPDGMFEILDRTDYGRTLFESFEDSERASAAREAEQARQRAAYEASLAETADQSNLS